MAASSAAVVCSRVPTARSLSCSAARVAVRSAISALRRPTVSLLLPISASWLVVFDFICSTQISSRRVATAIWEWTWSMSASITAITGGGMDWRRKTAERLARIRIAATMPKASKAANRNPIPRSTIGSLITGPAPYFRPTRPAAVVG